VSASCGLVPKAFSRRRRQRGLPFRAPGFHGQQLHPLAQGTGAPLEWCIAATLTSPEVRDKRTRICLPGTQGRPDRAGPSVWTA
jgi:hypothetical protein